MLTRCARKQDLLAGRSVPSINENAISNLLVDVDFLEDELRRNGRGHLNAAFIELRMVCVSLRICSASLTMFLPLPDHVAGYARQSSGIPRPVLTPVLVQRRQAQTPPGPTGQAGPIRRGKPRACRPREGREVQEDGRGRREIVPGRESII